MRTAIAITLIICGTLLVLAPAVHGYLLTRNVSELLLSRTDLTSIRGGEPMSLIYSFICWAMGAAMVGVAVVCSLPLPVARSRDVKLASSVSTSA